ncbi:MAG: LytR/AlgR family response regulator transcription factor [Christensenellales bacterium]|jgi:DNA-binding LytR/AlgR family response regulator|nr:response regulator transcription factor [Clostridiales bacterium]
MLIGICDDDRTQLQTIVTFAKRYFKDKPHEIHAFDDYLAFERSLFKGANYDICLLDILLGGETGIGIAKTVLEFNPDCQFIFISSSPDYAIYAFGLDAVTYILKPATYEMVEKALDKAMALRETLNEPAIFITTIEGDTPVYTKDIMYIEQLNRKAYYHLVNGTILETPYLRQKFSELVPKNKDNSFIHCQAGYIANLTYVKRLTTNSFILKNDKEIPISRGKYKEVKSIFFDFFAKKK